MHSPRLHRRRTEARGLFFTNLAGALLLWLGGPGLATAQQPAPPATLAGDLLSYTAHLTVRVRRIDDAAMKAETIARQTAGRVVSRRDGELTLTVPVGRLDEALRQLAAMGVELRRGVEVDNLTTPWLDTQARLRTAEQSRARLEAMARLASEGVNDPILLQREIAQVEDDMASIRAAIHGIEAKGSNAVVQLHLEAAEGVEPDPAPRFELPFPWLSNLGLDRLMSLQHTWEPPRSDEAAYHLHDEAEVSLGLAFVRPSDADKWGGTSMTVAGALRMRGVVDADPMGPAFGMDLGLGSGLDGGFLYDLRMLMGPGVTMGRHVSVGALAGAGISGLTGEHIPFGVDVPVEIFVATDLTTYAQVRLWGRTSWIAACDARQNGADHAPFGDEVWAGVSFVLGEDGRGENRRRFGLALGFTYGEMLGTRFAGLSVGYGAGFGDRSTDD